MENLDSQGHGRGVRAIAVIGAAGIVGKSLVRKLSVDPKVDRIVAVDKHQLNFTSEKVVAVRKDIIKESFSADLQGCDSVIYLVEDRSRRSDNSVAQAGLKHVLEQMNTAGVPHLVLLSSAMVYGAHLDNPIPITETHTRRPIPNLAHASIKTSLEELAESNAAASNLQVAILRPTTTVSDKNMSWISLAIRLASLVRSEEIDPPAQFLHFDDLVSALVLSAFKQLDGIYNVAPDGWIGGEAFRDLSSEPEHKLSGPLKSVYINLLKFAGLLQVPAGLETYINLPWVVSNDKLRNAGWEPTFTNEEAYIESSPLPYWRRLVLERRQEVALVGVGVAGVVAVVSGYKLFRWLLKK